MQAVGVRESRDRVEPRRGLLPKERDTRKAREVPTRRAKQCTNKSAGCGDRVHREKKE